MNVIQKQSNSFPPRAHVKDVNLNSTDVGGNFLPIETISSKRQYDQNNDEQQQMSLQQLDDASCSKLKTLLTMEKEISSKLDLPTDLVFNETNIQLPITLKIQPLKFLQRLISKLAKYGVHTRPDGVRLVGSAASYVVGHPKIQVDSLSDLDFTLYIDSNYSNYSNVLLCEEEVLADILTEQTGYSLSLYEVYKLFVRDTVVVYDLSSNSENCWSLFSFGSNDRFRLDIKVVSKAHRTYAFSLDSFEVVLNPILSAHFGQWRATNQQNKRRFSSTPLFAESLYGDFASAKDHMDNRLIVTKDPREIRRGAFRYCLELAKGNKPKPEDKTKLEYLFVEELVKEFGPLESEEDREKFVKALLKFVNQHPKVAYDMLEDLYDIISQHDTICRASYLDAINKSLRRCNI